MDRQLVRMQDAVPALLEGIEESNEISKKEVVDLMEEMMQIYKANGRVKFARKGMPALDDIGPEGGCQPS
jgi:hypothetical protein